MKTADAAPDGEASAVSITILLNDSHGEFV